ncbi:hypothetical protein F511_27024 [Dorcoceras hygrometricum]|uniref:Uncharacterized protein n=1 Tax=Dorcoceras hygrometricum TaxID=472368 RepID=A0A2Z7CUX3_9LAMI|nr:hypothetical protein F511_27024 [Dorcoceras hygrometricum]
MSTAELNSNGESDKKPAKEKDASTVPLSIRQSGPRPDLKLLRQTALEVLTRSARSDSPRKVGRKQISGDNAAAAAAQGGGGGGRERGEGGRLCSRFRVRVMSLIVLV